LKIIGITGTLGAGKGTIVDYLVEKYGFKHFSVRGYLIEVMQAKGLEINRDNMVTTANGLRATYGPSYIAEALHKQAIATNQNCIIESIRTLGEIEALRSKGNFTLFSVDTDRQIRYDRILLRASETDKVSFETFVENEERELTASDPNKQNLSACMALADVHFSNNGSFDELFLQIDKVLSLPS
jgi:dephospho-CoA kinase